MNSKVSFVNFNYLKENLKKSRGVIFLFVLIIPIFTYLVMLMVNSNYANVNYFPTLSDLSIPTLIGMYFIPFVMATTLFSFVFKRESVDFINALPMKRSTIFITNIIGGILVFFITLLITTILLMISGLFFDNLIIPKAMYFHYFITFFITYIFVFLASSLTVSLTGSKLAHVALTLIVLFIPGYLSDFYSSRVNDSRIDYNYYYPSCDKYDMECPEYEINNQFIVEKSFKMDNGQTLPYKYINTIPRAIFSMYNKEVLYKHELQSVYNTKSILKMIILSVIYFVLGLYAFVNRKMEVAESTFKDEHVHQIVKCITLFPLCLGGITIALDSAQSGAVSTILLIFLAITLTIYSVYDLITRRNSGNFMKSAIYFLLLVLVSFLTFAGGTALANNEASKTIEREDVAAIGIQPNNSLGSTEPNFNALGYKIKDKEIIDLIFDNVNKRIKSDEQSTLIATRISLKNGATYYFNVRLINSEYDKLLNLLNKDKKYTDKLKYLPYDSVYGIRAGNSYFDKESQDEILKLIKEGYKEKSVIDIIKATYVDNYEMEDIASNKLYVYKNGVVIYVVNSYINPKIIDYVMKIQNNQYIKDIANNNVNINRLHIWLDTENETEDKREIYYNFSALEKSNELIYRYINDNVKKDIDFSKYNKEEDIARFTIYFKAQTYHVFLPKDDKYVDFFKNMKEKVDQNPLKENIKGIR